MGTGLVVAMLSWLAVATAITPYWKISTHTAVAAGTATTLTITFASVVVAGWAVVAATECRASDSATTH